MGAERRVLVHCENKQGDKSHRQERYHLRVGPRVFGSGVGQHIEDQDGGDDEEGVADIVDLSYPLLPGQATSVRQTEEDEEDRQSVGTDREVQEENPAPLPIPGQRATDQRAKGSGHADDGEEQADEFPPLAERDHVANDDIHEHIDSAASDPLDPSANNEHSGVLCCSADGATQEEDEDGRDHEPSSSPKIGKLSTERLKDGTVVSLISAVVHLSRRLLSACLPGQEVEIDDPDIVAS